MHIPSGGTVAQGQCRQHACTCDRKPWLTMYCACAGTAIALAGVFTYSQVKRLQKKSA